MQISPINEAGEDKLPLNGFCRLFSSFSCSLELSVVWMDYWFLLWYIRPRPHRLTPPPPPYSCQPREWGERLTAVLDLPIVMGSCEIGDLLCVECILGIVVSQDDWLFWNHRKGYFRTLHKSFCLSRVMKSVTACTVQANRKQTKASRNAPQSSFFYYEGVLQSRIFR